MKVSIIIPCYNVQNYVERCLHSVRNQTYRDLEVICVNDGSTDGTLDVLNKFKRINYPDLKIISVENCGASAARNIGVSDSCGSYLQFLDADDILEPNKINHQIELVLKNNSPAIVVGAYRRVDESGKFISKNTFEADQNYNVWLMLMNAKLGITSSNLFKADFFQNGGQWDAQLKSSQEYELMFQILIKNTNVIFDSAILTTILQRNSGAISQSDPIGKWQRYVKLRIRIMEYLKKAKPEIITHDFYQTLFDSIRILYKYDPESANRWFTSHIPKNFKPRISVISGRSYIYLYRLLGFRRTECLRKKLIVFAR